MFISPGVGASTRRCAHCHAQTAAGAKFRSSCRGAHRLAAAGSRCLETASDRPPLRPDCGALLPREFATQPSVVRYATAAPVARIIDSKAFCENAGTEQLLQEAMTATQA
jgi:hypothetical protein